MQWSIGRKSDVFGLSHAKDCRTAFIEAMELFFEGSHIEATGHPGGAKRRSSDWWHGLVKEAISVYLRPPTTRVFSIFGGPGEVWLRCGMLIGTTQKYGRGQSRSGMRDKKETRFFFCCWRREVRPEFRFEVISELKC
ncbi:hypothetical protein BV898_17843 [Hypsibius exemplaris]|uniref:Uncharacterized protein n=1 Tax=Hypsibius exemplaris TaxID=2072580 RepID=A0A9X6NI00_HYPEX|nr:hypothetical protein BV898_17843 [Hypsibius exemplaris]